MSLDLVRSVRSETPGASTRSAASFSTADRAAVEPTAALVAVVVVGLGLGLYAGAFADATPVDDQSGARAALDRVEKTVTVGGVVDPNRMRRVEAPG
ncbi:hypothetical protein U4E84_18755, partial [Halorubrum sp. AD140]|nr:hypothetical protein [Halorubrum sp. AD140]